MRGHTSDDLFTRVQGMEFAFNGSGMKGPTMSTSSEALLSAREVEDYLKEPPDLPSSSSVQPSSSAQPPSETQSSSTTTRCRIIGVQVNKDKERFPGIRDRLLLPDSRIRKVMVRGTGTRVQDPFDGKATGSFDDGHILLQTPSQSTGPYFLLFLDVHNQVNNGIYVYDKDKKDDTYSGFFDLTENFGFNETELDLLSKKDRFGDSNTVEKPRAVEFIWARLAYIVVKAYLTWLQDTFHKIHKDLDSIEEQMDQKSDVDNDFDAPRRRLDDIVTDVQKLDLGRCSEFSLNSIRWLRTTMAHKAVEPDTQHLLEVEEEVDTRSQTVDGRADEIRKRIKMMTQQNILDETQKLNYQLEQMQLDISVEGLKLNRSTRAIAIITMAFLPATFVASFFGMNFFNGIGDWPGFDRASHFVWMFFLISVPITGLVLGVFFRWDYKEKQREIMRGDGSGSSISLPSDGGELTAAPTTAGDNNV